MGLLDALLGGRRKLKAPAPDRLFAMTTAQVTLETELGLVHRNVAGIVFQAVPTSDFQQIVAETNELLSGAAEETGTTVDTAEDEYGYRWVMLRDPDFEDLVVSLNLVSTQLQSGGYGDRLLCAVFPFDEQGAAAPRPGAGSTTSTAGRRPAAGGGRAVYFIYNFKRGTYYPFVPAGRERRDTERELRLIAQVGTELPVEQEIDRRLPLWEIPI